MLTTTTIQIGNVVLNSVDSNGVKWVARTVQGWGTSGSTIDVVQKPRQAGGWAGLAYAPPRFLTVTGTVYAPTPTALNTALDQLYAAVSLDATQFTVTDASMARSLMVRRSDVVEPTRRTNLVADFQFQVVAVDPRKLGTQLSGVTGLPSSTGGLTIPFTIPFTVNSTVVSGSVSLTNPGSEPGPVVLRIDGPCQGPVITHASSSTTAQLVFSSSLTLGLGEWLTVDMDARTALANDQSSRSSYITSRGWSQFDPGVNTWSFTAVLYDAASMLTVKASPAW